ncbi:hypothetical protein KC957_01980 [Candidatus Saccharibacteria bacterium]|nr:hypothetical protein [Candidatus Saccharibacteria bacterium]
MPVFYLFIASLVFFTYLFPEKISFFLRTILQWVNLQQVKQEEENARQDVVNDAMLDLVTWVATTQKQLRSHHKSEHRAQMLRQLRAAGERYLQTANHDEQPAIYRFTEEMVRDIEREMQTGTGRHGQR